MFEFELPDVGEGVAEGEIVAWHVEPGEEVTVDQVLAEVETDKAVVDLPSPVEGVVEELHAEVGDVVPVGDVVVSIDTGENGESTTEGGTAAGSVGGAEPGERTSGESDRSGANDTSGRVFAPPRVRRVARELDVDIGVVEGSGPGGRITEADVRALAEVREGNVEDSAPDPDGDTTGERPPASVQSVDETGSGSTSGDNRERGEADETGSGSTSGDNRERGEADETGSGSTSGDSRERGEADDSDGTRTPAVRTRDHGETEQDTTPDHSGEGGTTSNRTGEGGTPSDRSGGGGPESASGHPGGDFTAEEAEPKPAIRRREPESDEPPSEPDGETQNPGAGRVDGTTEPETASVRGQSESGRTVGDGVARDRTLAAPATRRLADELDVDIDDVPTDTERNGVAFVEPSHVRAYANREEETFDTEERTEMREPADPEESTGRSRLGDQWDGPDSTEPGRTAEQQTANSAGDDPRGDDSGKIPSDETGRPVRREPYRGTRRTIGQQMSESAFTAPHATHHDTVVVERLVETREELLPRASEAGVDLTYLPFVIKALVAALPEYPALNAELDEQREEIVYHDHYDIGVAVATDDGLLVPVVERADERGLFDLAATISELVERARNRELEPDQLQGSTFTLTNFGAIGGEYATPILNYPETAILGLGSIEPRPVVEDGAVVPRHTMGLSLSIDHRVVDGAEAAAFCNDLKNYLTRPTELLL